jgi:hypothetical protein
MEDYGKATNNVQYRSPAFDQCIRKIEFNIVSTASEVCKILPARLKRPNLIRVEYAAMESVSDLDIRYKNADRITDLLLIPKS